MNNKELAYYITDFFESHDMLEGATREEIFDATYNSLLRNDISDLKTILSYFKNFANLNSRAKIIYGEICSRLDKKYFQ